MTALRIWLADQLRRAAYRVDPRPTVFIELDLS